MKGVCRGVGDWLTGERAIKREGNEFPLVSCVFR